MSAELGGNPPASAVSEDSTWAPQSEAGQARDGLGVSTWWSRVAVSFLATKVSMSLSCVCIYMHLSLHAHVEARHCEALLYHSGL